MKYQIASLAAVAASVIAVMPAHAQSGCSGYYSFLRRCRDVVAVPEIDVSSGLLALAAVGAATLLAWELRRRGRQAD